MQKNERSKEINTISVISIITNTFLSAIKLITGFFAFSQALISDGVDSLADVFLTVIVIIGVNISEKKSDDNHQYGHEKLESIASIFLSSVLLAAAIGIGVKGVLSIKSILSGEQVQPPRAIALFVALISILAKEFLFRHSKKIADKTNSSVLLANAWNYRSDAIASVGSLIGIGGAMLGARIVDPIASIAIALLIAKVGLKIIITAIKEVTDHAADAEIQKEIFDVITSVDGVQRIDELRTRLHGSLLCVDVDIAVDKEISVEKAHNIADAVSSQVHSCKLGVKQCMVHINPYTK
ncbi:MAG: cation diffusion facilitator family transporter [Firmicutes bacterium]|nr:cation diffusion facilitator family transporter [Bacillota bacterium]